MQAVLRGTRSAAGVFVDRREKAPPSWTDWYAGE